MGAQGELVIICIKIFEADGTHIVRAPLFWGGISDVVPLSIGCDVVQISIFVHKVFERKKPVGIVKQFPILSLHTSFTADLIFFQRISQKRYNTAIELICRHIGLRYDRECVLSKDGMQPNEHASSGTLHCLCVTNEESVLYTAFRDHG